MSDRDDCAICSVKLTDTCQICGDCHALETAEWANPASLREKVAEYRQRRRDGEPRRVAFACARMLYSWGPAKVDAR